VTENTLKDQHGLGVCVTRDAAWAEEVRREIISGLADREAHSLPASLVGWSLCLVIATIIGPDIMLIIALLFRPVSIGLVRWAYARLRRTLEAGEPFEAAFRLAGIALSLSGLSWGLLTFPVFAAPTVEPAGLALLVLVITGVCMICSIIGLVPWVLVGFACAFALSVLAGSFIASGGSQPALTAAVLLPLIGAVPFGIGQRRQAIRAAEDAVDKLHLHEEVASALHHAEYLSRHDALTGLGNRRALFEDYGNFTQPDGPRTILSIDLDNFKSINDTFGHQAGDEVLVAVADSIRNAMRGARQKRYSSYRLGGEEFAIVLEQSDESAGRAFAEQLRQTIEKLVPVRDVPHLRISASFGVLGWSGGLPLTTALGQVDKLLYVAKERGRNCVVAHFEKRAAA
jgi:diguanylate cyclase (GGDEF)-like protein